MRGPDSSHHHHPPGLRIALAAVAVGLALAASAAAGHDVPLPSPVAPLSPSPPLGPATSITERVRHRVRSTVRVHVSVLPSGRPFAVAADQTLAVTVQGDYFFTIGAPLLGVEALPGSGASPGLRSTSVVWEGFNPGRRVLRSRAQLVPGRAAAALPLRIEVGNRSTTFVNTTGVTVAAFAADAEPAPLVDYLGRLDDALRTGKPPPEGTASLTGAAHATRVHVVVPLLVTGSVGGRRISALVSGRLTVPGRGKIAVSVVPAIPHPTVLAGLSGREVLAKATAAVLTAGRLAQYQRFLGNPDPTGSSTTVYLYRTATPRPVPVAVRPVSHGRDWTTTIAVAGGLLLAAAAGLAVWARA